MVIDGLVTESAPDHGGHRQPIVSTPADELIGVVQTQLGDGSIETHMRPLEQCTDEPGNIAAGTLFVLADTILGNAGIRRLPSDRFIVTSNLHIDLVARPTLTGGDISGAARIDAIDEFGVVCRTDLVDPAGRLIAVTTGRFAVVPRSSRHAGAVTTAATTAPCAARPPAAPRAGTAGAAVPMHELLGLELRESNGQVFQFEMHARAELSNERGGIHGGVGALAGEQVAGHALRLTLPPGNRMRPVEMRACFFRPVEASGASITCTAEVLHVGRRFAATRAWVSTPTGRIAVLVDLLHAPVAD